MIADSRHAVVRGDVRGGPSGLDYVIAYPVLDLGTEGRITIILPTLDKTSMMTRVPKLIGPLAGGHYDMLATARDDAAKAQPATITWLRGVNPSSTAAVSSWLPPPTAIAMTGGTVLVHAGHGATVHGAELQTMDGQRLWSITIFDGTTSFTLPGLSPDPLPLGTIKFACLRAAHPGRRPQERRVRRLADILTDISTDEITYSR